MKLNGDNMYFSFVLSKIIWLDQSRDHFKNKQTTNSCSGTMVKTQFHSFGFMLSSFGLAHNQLFFRELKAEEKKGGKGSNIDPANISS